MRMVWMPGLTGRMVWVMNAPHPHHNDKSETN
jgi:hypothetical protein